MSDFFPNPKVLKTIYNGIRTIDADENDRITSLPDAMLEDILARMPIKSAVATTALTHRWRHLWTHTPYLIFEDADILPQQLLNATMDNASAEKFQRFYTIVNHIVHQHNSPLIKTFHFEINLRPFQRNLTEQIQECSKLFHAWVPYICHRNVEEFKVIFPFDSYSWTLLDLPSKILESETLVELTLRLGMRIKYPKNGAILPNLKKLNLDSIKFDSNDGLPLLIHSCPLLEYFNLVLDHYNGDVLEVSGQNLKTLIIVNFVDINLVIDAPVLEEFSFEGDLDKPCTFVKFASSLIKVELNILSFGNIRLDNFDNIIPPLLDGIYNVNYMHLDNGLILFNAIHYLGNVSNIESRFVNLSHLIVDFYEHGLDSDTLEWVPESPIPESLMRRLKKIELLHVGGLDEETIIEFLEYILSKGDVLDLISVSSIADPRDFTDGLDSENRLWWEYDVAQGLYALPSSNPSCGIEFLGEHISVTMADSNDYYNVRLNDENPAIGATPEIR